MKWQGGDVAWVRVLEDVDTQRFRRKAREIKSIALGGGIDGCCFVPWIIGCGCGWMRRMLSMCGYERYKFVQRNVTMCMIGRLEILKPLSFRLPSLLGRRIEMLKVHLA